MNITYILGILISILCKVTTVNPLCNIVTHTSSDESNWKEFSSSTQADGSKNCSLYKFRAQSGQIVQLIFTHFNVGKYGRCSEGDHVNVYLHSASSRISNATLASGSLCGTLDEIPRVLYSSGTNLILAQYTAHNHSTHSPWFNGTYRFISNNEFTVEGVPARGKDCEYEFSSDKSSRRSGTFSSPRFPSGYKANQTCLYLFRAKVGERVKLIFNEVNLREGDASCLEQGGVIRVFEGRKMNSTSLTRVLCNTVQGLEYISSTDHVMVQLLASRTDWPPHSFTASYAFIIPATAQARTRLENISDSHRGFINITDFGVSTGRQLAGFECGFIYTAEDWPAGGIFTSPNYPGLYPRDTECHYFFQGLDWQKVNVTFIHVDIEGTPPLCNYKTNSDYLEFSNCLLSDGSLPRKCGRNRFTMISNKKYFHITFKSNSKLDATGFNATFRFFNDQTFHMTTIDKSSVSPNMIWCMTRTVLKLIFLFFLLN